MKERIIMKRTIIPLLLSVFFILSAPKYLSGQRTDNKFKTVVIDAGHGGRDPGALSKKVKEKNITLPIALKTGEYIKKNIPGVKVIYTRKTDKYIELHKRSEIANKNNADLFISIHVNSARSSKARGTETYVMGLNKTNKQLEVVKRENSVILKEENYLTKYEGFDPKSPETQIIFSLYQNTYLEHSIKIAEFVQSELRKKAKRADRDVKQAGFVVLWNCSMPGILIETGFITNPEEQKFLCSAKGQELIASSIGNAVKRYKKYIESKDYGEQTDQQIRFKVQVAYSRNKIETTPANFNGLENVECFPDGAYFRYFVGNVSSYEEVVKLQAEVRKKMPEAYVIAVNGNNLITVKDALQLLDNEKTNSQ